MKIVPVRMYNCHQVVGQVVFLLCVFILVDNVNCLSSPLARDFQCKIYNLVTMATIVFYAL